jgi:PBP1b-binding outer membrane lipoprotein LpoB
MKKHIALILAASTLLLAGCCTTEHATKWQYKTVGPSTSDEILNTPVAEGWSVVSFSVTPSGDKYFLLKHKQIH